MDIVYPLRKASRYNDIELRMSLRSIESYLLKFDKVFIIGHKPEWIKNIVHIPAQDPHDVPDRNIHEKILLACNHPEVSDDFLFMNDDHYLLSWFEAPGFPYYYHKTLDEYCKNRHSDQYGRRCLNTLNLLKGKELPTKFFDIHTPIIYNKQKYIEVMNMPWNDHKNGFVLKSVYANSILQEGIEYKDNKLNQPPTNKATIISSHPHMRHSFIRYLTEQFSDQSKYEKTGLAGI